MGSILVVEPDATTGDVWGSALEEAGHAVVLVTHVREALAHVREGGIDLVIIDAHATTGVADAARGIEALPDAPPIVLASSLPAAPELSVRIGAAHFLPTPCDLDELVEAVNRVLGHVRPVLVVVDDEPTGPGRYPASTR